MSAQVTNARDHASHGRDWSTSAGGMQGRLRGKGLDGKVLKFEHREAEPSFLHLPEGARRHLVFVILEGGVLERESEEGKARHDLSPGFVTILPSAHPVRWSWNSRLSFSLLALQPDFLCRVAEEHLDLSADAVQLSFVERKQDPVITSIAAALAREAVHNDAGSRLYADSLAHILAVHLLRNQQFHPIGKEFEMRPAPRAVESAVSFIQQNHARDIGLADISAAARLSPFHLSRLFRCTLGVAPYQYLIQTRVNSARALIMAGGGRYSLAEIAVAVGFADQSHLTRHFKRVLGTTPGKMAC